MSISRDQLAGFIENLKLLNERSIGGLKEIVDEYPYFQTAQLLYTYNLKVQNNFRSESQIKLCSLYAADRNVLYQLFQPLESDISEVPVSTLPDSESTSEDPLIDFGPSVSKTLSEKDLLPDTNDIGKNSYSDILGFESSDFMFELENEKQTIQSTDLEEKNFLDKVEDKTDLIGQFIKVNPTIQPRTEVVYDTTEISEQDVDLLNDGEEFITETLARIYLKQGHYQKAIDSFQRLSLKFPEKSVYFAQQIEEIKKLIN